MKDRIKNETITNNYCESYAYQLGSDTTTIIMAWEFLHLRA